MRDSEVIDHDNVSLLPAVEDQVAPHHVAKVLQVTLRDLGTISERGMKPNPRGTENAQEEYFHKPVYPGIEPVLEPTNTPVHSVELRSQH